MDGSCCPLPIPAHHPHAHSSRPDGRSLCLQDMLDKILTGIQTQVTAQLDHRLRGLEDTLRTLHIRTGVDISKVNEPDFPKQLEQRLERMEKTLQNIEAVNDSVS